MLQPAMNRLTSRLITACHSRIMRLRRARFIVLMLLLVAGLCGCNLSTTAPTPVPTPDLPRVEIRSPQNNQDVIEGTDFDFDIVARDQTAGIARVDLVIDGTVINSANPFGDNPVPVFATVMNWVARNSGLHVVEVIAYRPDDTPSDPARISINVVTR